MAFNYYDYDTIEKFLPCVTPDAWVQTALQNQDILLVDHAYCEKKAASAALSFLYRHTDKPDLMMRMSKIAREELVHFEQVMRLMKKRNIGYMNLSASRYAEGLRQAMRTCLEGRFIDSLIVGAFIEARSCERFAKVAPHLDDELKSFYEGLLASEKRHFTIYLQFAEQYATDDITPYIERIRAAEQLLIESPDTVFRFHSGVMV